MLSIQGSFDRSAIEEHEQDKHSRGLLAALVAVLRDVGTALISGRTSGISVIERCLCSYAHLVKRMGLYWLPLTGASPNQIIEFIISHGCLRDSYLIHETFMLLSTSYPSAVSEVKTLFMAEVRGSYPDVSDVNDAYGRFNVLKWLERHGAEDDLISAELAAIHESFPYFEVREYPDLGHYMSLGLESEDERFRVEEDDFSPEKLRELCIAAEESRSMLRRWDIVSAPMRQYPEVGLNVAGQLLSSSDDDYREMAKIALSSIRWEDLGDDSLCEASEVIVAGLQHDDTYSFAVRALDAFVRSLREPLLEKASLWQPALDLAFENVEWLSTEDCAIAESDKCDWLTVSINHASGALVEAVAKVIAASSTVDDNEAREFGRRYIGKLVSHLYSHDDCSRCLAASFLSEINIWVFVDVDLMRAALSRILEPGSPLLVPAAWGLSYVSRLSENSWNVLKSWFMQSLGEAPLAEAPQSKLASIFVWAAIVYGSYEDRRQAVTISSAMSPEACSAVSFRLLDWVGQLKDDVRNIEWETWLGDAISSMFVPDENFKAAGHYLVRWLKKCGCLAPKIGHLLISWRKRKCDGIFFERGSLRELVVRGAVTDVDRALLLVFFLSNGPTYHSITEFEEVAKGLDPDVIDKDALAELRDAFVLRFASVPDCLK